MRRATVATDVYGSSSSVTVPSALEHGEAVRCPSLGDAERDPAAVEEREARLAEHPVREADVVPDLDHRLDATGHGVQRYRLQNPLRSPLNHSDPSGAHAAWQIDSRASPPATTVRVDAVRHDEAGRVPRHVGVVPLDPAPRRPVRRPARARHEVGARDDDRRARTARRPPSARSC